MLKQDFHLRHSKIRKYSKKEKQEYWRAPILWVTSFCTLVCPFFLSGLFILFLIEKLDEPHRTHHTWFTVFLPMWLGFLIVGIGMCSAIKASKHRLDNNNNDNNNNNNRAREHERQQRQRQQQEHARENERRQQNPNQRIQQRIGQDGLRWFEEEEWNPRPNNNNNNNNINRQLQVIHHYRRQYYHHNRMDQHYLHIQKFCCTTRIIIIIIISTMQLLKQARMMMVKMKKNILLKKI